MPGLAENRPSVLRGDCLFVRCCDAAGNATGNKEFKGYVHNTRLDEVWLGFHQRYRDSPDHRLIDIVSAVKCAAKLSKIYRTTVTITVGEFYARLMHVE